MTFDLTPTEAQHDPARHTHEFAEQCIHPVARCGFHSPLFHRDLIGYPTGLSLPMFAADVHGGAVLGLRSGPARSEEWYRDAEVTEEAGWPSR